ncbi:MAG: TonB family protein [Pararhodobacter sp.]|nr:TonB family protein [Pararhodobacter sp.]
MTAAMTFPENACLNPECVRSAARTATRRLVRPSWKAIVLSVVVSVVAHLSALAALVPNDNVQIAGGAPAALAALGNSFADFTQGSTPSQPAAAEPSPTDPPRTPDTTRETTPPVQPSPSPSAQPQALAMTVPAAPALAAPEAADPVVPLVTDPEAPRPEALSPMLSAAAPSAQPVAEPAPSTSSRPVASPAQAAPATPLIPVSPSPEVTVQQADAASPRPQRRPDPRQDPAPRQQAQTSAASAPQAAGNADQDARRGSAEGAASASATATGSSGEAAQAGNAAVSNYPGQVMDRIRRTRQERVSGRGVAVVSFSVSNGGALASATIQRSSGTARIDAAALAHIRRAAPFPVPPAGATRSFSFEFVVR